MKLKNYLPWSVTVLVVVVQLYVVFQTTALSSTEVIPLHFNIIIGTDELGKKSELWKVPITSSLIVAFNFLLALYLHVPPVHRRILGWVSALFAIITLMGLILVLQ